MFWNTTFERTCLFEKKIRQRKFSIADLYLYMLNIYYKSNFLAIFLGTTSLCIIISVALYLINASDI